MLRLIFKVFLRFGPEEEAYIGGYEAVHVGLLLTNPLFDFGFDLTKRCRTANG